ncbi:hypothetical protein FQN50_009640 [Emmonsiellopsis sp. PD_5]|nr:hypothetical protein FQN50_009640 [Emmonsiellopsis sp. PD_5]
MAPNIQNDAPQVPARKQSKWSPEEDAKIIGLWAHRVKWEDISKELLGRSAISCHLHYQNYLERRSEWDESRKDRLARLYERSKAEIWAKIAEEMGVPWRAAEAMHWQLGEEDIARRAGTVLFSFSQPASEPPQASRSLSVPLPSIAELDAAVRAYASEPPKNVSDGGYGSEIC